ncbi:MAG: biopolymer transporter ExbD [Verrucomicrobiales bacterium]|nr:biopolymer transporter ExbD [Verrucomicrobiales bacterium]
MPRGRHGSLMGEAEPKLDMSPMIDLVFLLLIFFMIASTMVTFKKDKNVKIPTASAAVKAKLVAKRVIINIYEDGRIGDENSNPITTDQIEQLMQQTKATYPEVKLHLRADRNVPHRAVKEVVQASARGGVSVVIYSTYEVGD